MDRHEVENLRRSIAMQTTGSPAIDRDQAVEILGRLYDLERLVDEIRRLLADLSD